MNNEWPRITIVTPSFNQGPYIGKTIESVLSQDYPDLEYIVMDGGSRDGTLDILRSYGNRIRWISEKDKGQSDALNKGFNMASGTILAFINSDDMYEPGALAAVANYFMKNPDAHWVTGKCRIIDAVETEIRKPITAYKNMWLRTKNYSVLRVLDYISQPATFWTRALVDAVGPFDENLHYSMDYDFSLRIGKQYSLHFIPRYLAAFRIHSTSKSDNIRQHFDADRAIAGRYSHSVILRALHCLHNEAIIAVYKTIQPK